MSTAALEAGFRIRNASAGHASQAIALPAQSAGWQRRKRKNAIRLRGDFSWPDPLWGSPEPQQRAGSAIAAGSEKHLRAPERPALQLQSLDPCQASLEGSTLPKTA